MMIEEVVSAVDGQLVTLDEAKRQLGMYDPSDESRVAQLLSAARDICEHDAECTLRQSVVRRRLYSRWPLKCFVLKWPPVLTLDSITYYDTGGASQTLASSNYRTNIDAAGFMRVEWDDGATLPDVDTRQDAVTVNYTCGQTALPPAAKHAILLTLTNLDNPEEQPRSRMRARDLLGRVSAPSYS